MALLFLSNALQGLISIVERLVPPSGHLFPREFIEVTAPFLIYLALAVALWTKADWLTSWLVPSDAEGSPRGGEAAFRRALRLGLAIGGLLIAASTLTALVSNLLQYIDPPPSPAFGAGPGEYFRNLSLTYFLGSLAELAAGTALVLGSAALSRRIDLSDHGE